MKKPVLREQSDLDRECLMTAEDFLEEAGRGFIPSDGSGYWATENMVSGVSCWNKQPKWATHVCWFNN